MSLMGQRKLRTSTFLNEYSGTCVLIRKITILTEFRMLSHRDQHCHVPDSLNTPAHVADSPVNGVGLERNYISHFEMFFEMAVPNKPGLEFWSYHFWLYSQGFKSFVPHIVLIYFVGRRGGLVYPGVDWFQI